MRIFVNGEAVEVEDGTRILELVMERFGLDGRSLGRSASGGSGDTDTPRGVAVALNAEVVPRSRWDKTSLKDGDRVEILGASQGG